ncbi:MAG: TIGR03790 family protein [Bryobacterales bacterium]|nr:TIGR03790 family protein [Bryobacterales bacterium]
MGIWRLGVALALTAALCPALTRHEVLILGNARSPVSRSIVEYYARQREIPPAQILYLQTAPAEEIDRQVYQREIAAPVAAWLKSRGWVDRILAIVTTTGVPLKIRGSDGSKATAASVDSELACLYSTLRGTPPALAGPLMNPYFRQDEPFSHPKFPLYLVTRLTGYSFEDVRGMIDRSLRARNTGRVAIDRKGEALDDEGELWLYRTAAKLPGRVIVEESAAVQRNLKGLIGSTGWGSNDKSRKDRNVGFQYLPGAIVSEFVSTNARTFTEPPPSWNLGEWGKTGTYFAASPQSMSGDAIRQGATGVSGHVYEPYLTLCPRPEYLFPAYLGGRTLAESFYAALPALSWMNVIVGDPLTRLLPP